MIITTKFTPVSPAHAQSFISIGYLELVICGKAVGTWRRFVVSPNAKANRGGALILLLCAFFYDVKRQLYSSVANFSFQSNFIAKKKKFLCCRLKYLGPEWGRGRTRTPSSVWKPDYGCIGVLFLQSVSKFQQEMIPDNPKIWKQS